MKRARIAKFRTEVIGDATLILGDYRGVLPTLPKVDAVVTDPPYGISQPKAMAAQAGKQPGRSFAAKIQYIVGSNPDWDMKPPLRIEIDMLRSLSSYQIFFGGNYFNLPPARCWLVWDKRNGDNAFADCELAWTNLDKPVRKISWLWSGAMRAGAEERNGHPTQKPLGVMQWVIEHLPKDAQIIFDPFMGSGTTGVACLRLGRKFIGIEIDPKYFDIACRRIDKEYRNGDFLKSDKIIKTKQSGFV